MELPLSLPRGLPLQRAIYQALRAAILERRLVGLERLPSSRALARQLGTSRGTVVAVYDQLLGEGYLSARVGSGTVVSEQLPDSAFTAPSGGVVPTPRPSRAPKLSGWAQRLETPFPLVAARAARPFRAHLPAVDLFPEETWGRLVARAARREDRLWQGAGDVRGWLPLRRALVEHLRVARAIRTTVDHLVVLPSLQQALDLVARLVLDPGDQVWLEDPGYVGAQAVFRAVGAKVVPVPVDDRGLEVARAIALAPNAKLAVVTPSHQWPLGVTLAIERRLELLAWARAKRRYVYEDDYDSEYRYAGRPVPALKSLDTEDLVIHAGTFSKTLLPSLRLAYVVVPDALLERFLAAKSLVDRFTPVVLQAALASFIEQGHFERHLRRMRVVYAERRRALLDALEAELGGVVEPVGARAGLGLTVRVPEGVNDVELTQRLGAAGVEAMPLSALTHARGRQGGLLLGFAPFVPVRLRRAVEVLASEVNRAVVHSPRLQARR
jgi:GntR family transcriptional regulator / MocR family aminotransferase